MEYQVIGKIGGTHGLDGKLVLRHKLEGKQAWKKISHVFIELRRESYIPFFIENLKILDADEVLVALDEIDSVEKARGLTGKSVYMEKELFASLQPKAVMADMVGYTITDKVHGLLGKIAELYETPGQVLAEVNYKGKQVMVPLVDATITSVDATRRNIEVRLPDGLLEVYL
ncbi:MAG: ribosome maturation factor RimM [Edaphocola sp.]